MADDALDLLSNLCADLVSLRKYEPALVRLFRDRPAGAWTPVRDLYAAVGDAGEPIKEELAAAWLPGPGGDAGSAVVVFFDDETKWSMTADYNVTRLLTRHQVAAAG
ncbi:MAG: hypothetical protein K2P78_14990 [Gemmataceae bacterium]|nr:hypothetical protein [Gemmataceae bacterium]